MYYFYSYSILSVIIKNRIITDSSFAPGTDGDLEAKPKSLTRHNIIIGISTSSVLSDSAHGHFKHRNTE